MHKSRLAALIIDCKTDDLDAAARFWSEALGKPVLGNDGKYATLATRSDEPKIEVQRVDHDSRVHIDIESDDVDAEVDRLEGLGATRVEKIHSWWVMQAPTGQRFCVVRPQRGPIDDGTEWP